MASLRDIARAAGVSSSLVSRVLSPKPDYRSRCSEATRERILGAAAELGYTPNRAAEFLKRGQNSSIGIFLPKVANRLIADLMFGIAEAAAAEGFPVTFSPGQSVESYREFIKSCARENPCGIISYPTFGNPQVQELLAGFRRKRGQLLLLNSEVIVPEIPVVRIDNYEGGRLAAEHLLRRDCAAYATCMEYSGRTQGYVDYLHANGCEATCFPAGLPDSSAVLCKYCKKNAKKGAVGLFAATDFQALRVMRALEPTGLRIGREVLLVGYDDLDASAELNPALTTVHQPFYEEGQLAVRKLIGLIYGNPEDSVVIAPRLVVRDSA